MTRYILDTECSGLKCFDRDKLTQHLSIHKVFCITLLDLDTQATETFCGEDEKAILQQLLSRLEGCTELVGFNTTYDLSFIWVRSFLNGLSLPKGFRAIPVTDLRTVLNPYEEYPTGRLKDYATQLGFQADTHDGREMPILYQQKKWEEIKAHNIEDCKLTFEIYKKAREANLLNLR